MTEEEARLFYLVRAIETEDRMHHVLTGQDRDQADAAARGAVSAQTDLDTARDTYLAERARFSVMRLGARNPVIGRVIAVSRWPDWLSLALPVAALALVFVMIELGNASRLDLLAVPLVGMIAWNIFAYLLLIFRALRKKKHAEIGQVVINVLARLRVPAMGVNALAGGSGPSGSGPSGSGTSGSGPSGSGAGGQVVLPRAISGFARGWAALSAKITRLRGERTLHLCAALFALGVICGIYLSALTVEYRAGWESTFLGPEAVHGLLSALLGPASAVTGVALPDIAGIAALRWSGAGIDGANAAPWIYLYTATAVGLIVVPRLLLFALTSGAVWRVRRHFFTFRGDDFYTRRLLRSLGGGGGRVRVIPYAYRPMRETQAALEGLLRAALGDDVRIRHDDPVAYGEEDIWISRASFDPSDDMVIVLFSLSATPEQENHGALIEGVKARLGEVGSAADLAAIIDEGPFRAHFAGLSGIDRRAEERRGSWRAVMGEAGVVPIALDIAEADPARDAQQLEAGLLYDVRVEGAAV